MWFNDLVYVTDTACGWMNAARCFELEIIMLIVEAIQGKDRQEHTSAVSQGV